MMLPALTPHSAILAAVAAPDPIIAKTHWELVVRILAAWGLTFVLGFERQLRGAMAGDRTFSLLGASTALIGALSAHGSQTILAGAVTGIGFIGGGLCFRQTVNEHDILHGICTAASIFAAAAIGAACGLGLLKEAAAVTILTLLTLELRHIPVLRALDARRWTGRFHHDEHMGWLQACEQLIPGQRNRAALHDHDHDHDHDQTGDFALASPAAVVAGQPADAPIQTAAQVPAQGQSPDESPTTSQTADAGVDAVLLAQQEAAITAATVDIPPPSGGGRG